MISSYKECDVKILLKDITGLVEPLPTEKRESNIQSGMHYCEMLPIEYIPSKNYIQVYNDGLRKYARKTAEAIGKIAEQIYKEKGNKIVIVSLARAGISIGVLIKRYLQKKYNIQISHYAISIIRGKEIDNNAMNYILSKHLPGQIQFVDGWIGKGAIKNELEKSLMEYAGVSTKLAVVSDPAHLTSLCGTREDFLIPSACLNSTVSGLISRSFLRKDIISKDDYHGAVFYSNLIENDKTYEFIDTIEDCFTYDYSNEKQEFEYGKGLEEVSRLSKKFNVKDINLIKPGIGETTRVLLRRVPRLIIINDSNKDSRELDMIKILAEEKKVEIIYETLSCYKCVGLIKQLKDI